ncbi:TPA: ribosomal protein S5-alanine N-acetyltransferase [Vibrio diabolicus]|jgi:ribosomal-protein-alanine N-acetyltransferase|uniref:ribosomal protein S5-alanine N-acetyltransferase n=1 Tax=Vibrio TaxID=662 RepID=UPI0006B27A1C|nr:MULTISPECIES: ribosomal protein S5-alanine N-acetyltransferase [Vibrio]MCR9495533.1 ribosomal protein S5-alanine N-acetyltransferase [Vibrio alginolyticus]KOY44364.1 ribosomal-protein-alanine acetyltransferase [Vibrio parahaemolyticus]MCE9844733.1 ribosomal protein S5-alanine N-acetyltransferase [Vibrio antiquarius]MCG9540842.1 ribosomal protein S5-alanine N-acetyltransferase [Vibrio parahaemolyticus]MCG9622117.1 ribosomal protein S5-alanine N-acetyltransferase [Vibrio diabolicus]
MEDNSSSIAVHKLDGDLLLRTAEIGDADMIAEYFQANREYLKPFEPKREEAFFSVNGWLQKLIKLNELHRMGLGYYCLLVRASSGEMLGTVSFSNLSRFPFYSCNVGYSLAEKAQGHGYMRRGLTMACDYMFNVQKLHRIQAGYMPHNKRSEAVLEHVGFNREGYAKDYLLINGEWQDHVLTSLINPNWQPEGR